MQDFICISILRFFGNLDDPRQLAKVLYPLQEIVLVALCAAICGADTFVEMEDCGNSRLDFLKRFLPFKNVIPGHDTFGAVFANLDVRQFNDVFVKWIMSFQQSLLSDKAM